MSSSGGDADGEDKAKARELPKGLKQIPEESYTASRTHQQCEPHPGNRLLCSTEVMTFSNPTTVDPYGIAGFKEGWAISGSPELAWPVHCYGMVGVGRDLPPNTGSGAELYTVIGHAPRHLDRNIALVGRVIEGIEHLSSLPRGTGALGFYETAEERTPIVSIRLGGEVPALPAYEYLSTESATFAKYADSRANRRDPFFILPAGGADICNIPVPVRRVK